MAQAMATLQVLDPALHPRVKRLRRDARTLNAEQVALAADKGRVIAGLLDQGLPQATAPQATGAALVDISRQRVGQYAQELTSTDRPESGCRGRKPSQTLRIRHFLVNRFME